MTRPGQGWRLIDTGRKSGAFNMALDECILNSCISGACPATLRFYQWGKPGLSIGYAQKEADINWDRCFEKGIEVVRRPTGGKALLHRTGLACSIVSSKKDLPFSALDYYKVINLAFAAAYRALGIEVHLLSSPSPSTEPVCFSSLGISDLGYRDGKVVASAQLRKNGAFLQQSYLPIRHYPELLFSLLNFRSDEEYKQSLASFQKQAACLGEAFQRKTVIGINKLKRAIIYGFKVTLGIEFEKEGLTTTEMEGCQTLIIKKYCRKEWNRCRKWRA